jgi:hypothetical protein
MEILIWIGFIITILILFYITYINYKIMKMLAKEKLIKDIKKIIKDIDKTQEEKEKTNE